MKLLQIPGATLDQTSAEDRPLKKAVAKQRQNGHQEGKRYCKHAFKHKTGDMGLSCRRLKTYKVWSFEDCIDVSHPVLKHSRRSFNCVEQTSRQAHCQAQDHQRCSRSEHNEWNAIMGFLSFRLFLHFRSLDSFFFKVPPSQEHPADESQNSRSR